MLDDAGLDERAKQEAFQRATAYYDLALTYVNGTL